MQVCERFYTGEEKAGYYRRLIRLTRWRRKLNDGYLITLPVTGHGLLEIYSQSMASQPYPNDRLIVVGAAADMQEARELVRQIIDDCIKERNDLNIAAFFGREGV